MERDVAGWDVAGMIEAKDAEIEELRSWKAAEEAHHHLLRQRIGNLEGMLGQALPYVTKCADMDLADAVACMMLIEHELRGGGA
jgi:hypothetical protein